MSARTRAALKPGQAPHPLSVYDGQLWIGEIEDRGRGRVTAYALREGNRVKIGTFETRADAMRAIGGQV